MNGSPRLAGKQPPSVAILPPSTAQCLEPRMLTVKHAAAYLGATVWFLRMLAWSRKVPHSVFGKRIVFDRADLDRYVDSQKVCAA
jgi:excisionase family DNA binding protein